MSHHFHDLHLHLHLGAFPMNVDLTALVNQVAESGTVKDSVLVFLQGVKDQLAAVETDNAAVQAQIDAIVGQLDAQEQELAAAITANTPAEGEPEA